MSNNNNNIYIQKKKKTTNLIILLKFYDFILVNHFQCLDKIFLGIIYIPKL